MSEFEKAKRSQYQYHTMDRSERPSRIKAGRCQQRPNISQIGTEVTCFSSDQSFDEELVGSTSPLIDDDLFSFESEDSSCCTSTISPNTYMDDMQRKPAAIESPLFLLHADVLAVMLTFLDPRDTLKMLTTPLCKKWQIQFGSNQDLWKTLCLSEPFNATITDDESSAGSLTSLPVEPAIRNVFGEYRLMFTSFVRCLRYLDRIQEDARRGRPSTVNHSPPSGFPHFGVSKSLKKFLHQKKHVFAEPSKMPAVPIQADAVGVTDNGYRKRPSPVSKEAPNNKKVKYGKSMITSRLLGPSSKGDPSHLQLPTTCSLYSIVNWMVAYPEVEGIQIKCVATLPVLLEDEIQRLQAQRVGLVEVVLRSMLRFPNSPKLHVAAFHSMVFLARPLGGREGMLFNSSMASSNSASTMPFVARPSSNGRIDSFGLDKSPKARLDGVNGISIMLESMKRFTEHADLQAMACWALVNLALVPAQKSIIMDLGGIGIALNAMRRHPTNTDVQFRALFALINLVVSPKTATTRLSYDTIEQVAVLVVQVMTNFCSSTTILNRACLVLHNIAQNHDYLSILLHTPHCYQLIEWATVNHPTDPVLRRAATSILHRLQTLLASDDRARHQFSEAIRSREALQLLQKEVQGTAP